MAVMRSRFDMCLENIIYARARSGLSYPAALVSFNTVFLLYARIVFLDQILFNYGWNQHEFKVLDYDLKDLPDEAVHS